MGDVALQVDALDYLFGIVFNSGEIRKSLEPAQSMLDLGREHNDLVARISGDQVLGMAYCALGELEKARHHLESALETNGQEVTGINCYPSMTLDYLSYVMFFLGDYPRAAELVDQAIESARSESLYATASALSNSCFTEMMLGNHDRVLKFSEEVISLANDRGQYMYLDRGHTFHNLARAHLEGDRTALESVVAATNRLVAAGEYIDLTYIIGMTAEAQLALHEQWEIGN